MRLGACLLQVHIHIAQQTDPEVGGWFCLASGATVDTAMQASYFCMAQHGMWAAQYVG